MYFVWMEPGFVENSVGLLCESFRTCGTGVVCGSVCLADSTSRQKLLS